MTNTQRQVYDFLVNYYQQNGVMPMLKEICYKFGWSSQFSAFSCLRQLERQGLLRKVHRGFELINTCPICGHDMEIAA